VKLAEALSQRLLTEPDLGDRYDPFCDPRLNAEHPWELALVVAKELKSRRR
jgi:3-deoxy-7-phosphoheptulonate synthase